MECCFQILFLNEVTFKSCDVIRFHHCTDICVVIVYSFYVPGVFRVQKQMSVGALSIVQHLFPTSVSHLNFLYSFIFLPCLGLCETDLPKGKIKKKEVSGPLKLWSGSSVLQYFLFTPPDMQTCAVSYSTFFLAGKTLANFMTEEKKQERLIHGSQVPEDVLDIVVYR